MFRTFTPALTREAFYRDHFQRTPHSEPETAAAVVPLLTWDRFVEMIAADPRPDMIVSQGGKLLSGAEPKTANEARSLFGAGCSIALRDVERFDTGLRELVGDFAAAMEGDVNAHAFATPAGNLGFGWHYDCEDVFILQTAGTKEYALRANSVNPAPTLDAMPRDMQYERETAPTLACTLVAGDWLYIPRGWWHRGRALDDSLSISVGVLSPAARGTAVASERFYR